MTTTSLMKAAVVSAFGAPLQIRHLPVPEPRPDEVLVRIDVSGLCGTDIHAARGDWPVRPALPFIPGHEGIGHVEKIGTSVHDRQVGDRVAIAWLGSACGSCRYCVDGRETLCEQQRNSGYSVNGTLADFAVVPSTFATPVAGAAAHRAAAASRRRAGRPGRSGRCRAAARPRPASRSPEDPAARRRCAAGRALAFSFSQWLALPRLAALPAAVRHRYRDLRPGRS